MNKALYIGTVPMDFLDRSESNWRAATMEDIIQERLITPPPELPIMYGYRKLGKKLELYNSSNNSNHLNEYF